MKININLKKNPKQKKTPKPSRPCEFMSYYVIPYHAIYHIPCHILLCHITYTYLNYHVILYHTLPHYTIPIHTIPYRLMYLFSIQVMPYQRMSKLLQKINIDNLVFLITQPRLVLPPQQAVVHLSLFLCPMMKERNLMTKELSFLYNLMKK